MAEEDWPPAVDPYQVAEIVSSYVRHHQIAADQLARLVIEVYRAPTSLEQATPVQEPPRSAVPIQRSVQQDYVVCLECGFRAQMPRRHMRVAHGLTATDYRTRWRLLGNYPLTAPAYSARRSRLAKEIGFGRGAMEQGAPGTKRPPRRRGDRRPRGRPAT
jgi:predicted transcriptional regulator